MPKLDHNIGPEVLTTNTSEHSKQGSCSPPSLASTEKIDGELDVRKALFFSVFSEKYKNMPENERTPKINQMWEGMDEKSRIKCTDNVLKRKLEFPVIENKKMKYESRPGIAYNPERFNPVVVSQKNIGMVAKALGVETSPSPITLSSSVPSTSEEIDIKPRPRRPDTPGSSSGSMRSRVQDAFRISHNLSLRSSLEQAKSAKKILLKTTKEPMSPLSLVINKDFTAPKIPPKRILVTNKSFPAPLPPEVQDPLPAPPPILTKSENSKPLQSTYTLVSVRKEHCEAPKKEIKKIFKKSTQVKKISYNEACEKFYSELSLRSLANCQEEKKRVNLEPLAHIVQGWLVTDYHGLL